MLYIWACIMENWPEAQSATEADEHLGIRSLFLNRTVSPRKTSRVGLCSWTLCA